MILFALILWLYLFGMSPAEAAFLVPFILPIVGGSLLAANIIAYGIGIAVSFGVSYVASKLLAKKPPETPQEAANQDVGGAELNIKADSDIPYSIIFGRAVVAGSRVYTNTYGNTDGVDNSDLVEIISLADYPCTRLAGAFVAGLPVAFKSIGTDEGAWAEGYTDSIGVLTPDEYFNKFGLPTYGSTDQNGAYTAGPLTDYGGKLRVRFLDGNQTVADSFASGIFASDPDYPWNDGSIGTGVCYVRIHSIYDGEKIQSPLQWTWVVDGAKLYDPRKDTTVGGSGSHSWGNIATYEFSANPAVICYNILRGIYYGGKIFYGLEGTQAYQLPLDVWFAAMNECDVSIPLASSGTEPQFRAGGEIAIDVEPLEACKALLKACGGRLTEIGGVFKLYIGAPGVPSLTFTDGDLLANKSDTFNVVLPLAERVNYVTAKFTSPADGWVEKIPPPRSDAAMELEDGRRLPADLVSGMVQSETQIQRLQVNLLQRVRRERKHIIPLPPIATLLEPGDVFEWNSVRNGYTTKLFEIDSVDYDSNLNVTVSCTEVDPADYDWSTTLEIPPVDMQIVMREPGAKIVRNFVVVAFVYLGANTTSEPAIKLTWTDPVDADSINLLWQVRLASDPSSTLMSGSTSNVTGGYVIIAGGLNPGTNYEVRAKFESQNGYPSAWSAWLPVTTPDVRTVLAHFSEELRNLVTKQFTDASDKLAAIEQKIAAAAADQDAQNWLDNQGTKEVLHEEINALGAQVEINGVAFGTLESSFASYSITTSAQVAGLSASVTTNSTAIASVSGKVAAAGYSVTLDVNGYVSSLKALNDGTTASWTFVGDIFRVAFPGVGGGAPTTVFQIGNVNGAAKVALRGDMYIDGSISALKMVTHTITAASAIIADAAIMSANIQDAAITTAKIQDLSVQTFKIAGAAITAPGIAFDPNPVSGIVGLAVVLTINNTVTLEPGYQYYAVINGWFDYTSPVSAGVGGQLYINGALVEGQGVYQSTNLLVPLIFAYALPLTGSGGPQTTTAQLAVFSNYGGISINTKLLTVEIMKR